MEPGAHRSHLRSLGVFEQGDEPVGLHDRVSLLRHEVVTTGLDTRNC
jgi:hypothetical protein